MSETKKDSITALPGATQNSDILIATAKHVLDLFNEHGNSGLTYHNYQLTVDTVALIEKMKGSDEVTQFSAESLETAQLSAWFSNTGFLVDYENPEKESIAFAKAFLEGQNYPANKIKAVTDALLVARSGAQPATLAEQLISDAVNANEAGAFFAEKSPLLRLEWELMQNRYLSTFDWNQLQLQKLLQIRFYTPHGKQFYEQEVARNILSHKRKVERGKLSGETVYEADGSLRKFQDLEKKLPNSATQTFFRANYRNHINLSSIADNKANIMISVNAILISVLISLLTYQNITETTPMVLMPIVIFLVTGLTSLIFAILSIRPKVTSLNQEETKTEVAKRNIVFFGNFVNLPLEQYEEAMDAVFRDGELLYGNMVRDLYYLGKVLDKKYRFLTMAYNTFMIGFVVTVLTFMIAIFS